ncbi:MAG: hypothetical protein JXX14_00705, partial [Deltaproteobacteria bacterium]|nr:hypothetical protein [Deltaproteobacteria bacterium]
MSISSIGSSGGLPASSAALVRRTAAPDSSRTSPENAAPRSPFPDAARADSDATAAQIQTAD